MAWHTAGGDSWTLRSVAILGVGEVRMQTGATLRAGLLWAMVPFVVVYAAGLAMPGAMPGSVVDGWLGLAVNRGLGLLTVWLPAVLCWLAVARVGLRRWEVWLAAVAVTSYAAGNTYWVVSLSPDGSGPFPSPADVGFLLFYPVTLAAVLVVVRHRLRGHSSSVWLDSMVGFLGAAAVLSVVLSPVLASAVAGSLSLATVVAVAYPLFDVVLVAGVAGVAALGGIRMTSRWGLLVAGLMVFAATDMIYALRVNDNGYVVGTPLDAAWAIGLALIALWVDRIANHDEATAPASSPGTGATALVVSALATAAGLGVLVAGSRAHLSALTVVLATGTLLAAAARTQVAFRQLLRMAHLRRQATTDHLTGLPNRRALYAQADARMADPEHRRQALLLLDLDRFKEVNDSLGHQAGDQLLIQVGARLGGHLRAGDLLVRLGGDEFAVLLDDAGADQAAAVSVKLCAALAEPFALDDIAVHSSASIGIALFPNHGPDLNTLLRKADIAMYKAKAAGAGHHAYGGTDDTDFTTRLRTVEELRTALSSDQVVVHYQPKIDLRTNDVHGVEALVRWEHPTRGLLYPGAFLDLVEEAGLMRALTRVVLEIALDQAAVWRAHGRDLTVAVNLSASSMIDTDLPDQIAAMLVVRDLPPGALQLEITEEFLMVDRDRARKILTRLRQIGIQISIDDFGTGYSSLSYLRDLPVDELKLDRSFIIPMADDPRAAALVASTIALAHSLGLRMVAEGVENDVAYAELARLGCDQAQGYYMSRPVPSLELDLWLNTRGTSDDLMEIPRLLPSLVID